VRLRPTAERIDASHDTIPLLRWSVAAMSIDYGNAETAAMQQRVLMQRTPKCGSDTDVQTPLLRFLQAVSKQCCDSVTAANEFAAPHVRLLRCTTSAVQGLCRLSKRWREGCGDWTMVTVTWSAYQAVLRHQSSEV
jgi:hypothetical protein